MLEAGGLSASSSSSFTLRDAPSAVSTTSSLPDVRSDTIRPQIVYALVAAGPENVLAESVAESVLELSDNIKPTILQMLRKLDGAVESKSYKEGNHAFHYLQDREAGLCYVCLADKSVRRQVAFEFLGALQQEARPSPAAIRAALEEYNDPSKDRVTALRQQVAVVNDSLMENLDMLMVRQEKIEVLLKRVEDMRGEAASFNRTAGQMNRYSCRRKAKVICGVVSAGLLVVALGLVFSCGITLEICRG